MLQIVMFEHKFRQKLQWFGRLIKRINPYSAGIDFSHQNLTSKVHPRTVRVDIFIMAVDP